jgi:hypothetical protein
VKPKPKPKLAAHKHRLRRRKKKFCETNFSFSPPTRNEFTEQRMEESVSVLKMSLME